MRKRYNQRKKEEEEEEEEATVLENTHNSENSLMTSALTDSGN